MMVDVVPIYLKPTRNAYSVWGHTRELNTQKKAIREKIAQNPPRFKMAYLCRDN